jgi:hypothetical protein
VFDLLSTADSRALVGEAARILAPGGLLGLVGLTHGTTASSRVCSACWQVLAQRWPPVVGGCRPIDLRELIAGPAWSLVHSEVVVRYAVPSQVLIATRRARA